MLLSAPSYIKHSPYFDRKTYITNKVLRHIVGPKKDEIKEFDLLGYNIM
jgi:hypothetical protein